MLSMEILSLLRGYKTSFHNPHIITTDIFSFCHLFMAFWQLLVPQTWQERTKIFLQKSYPCYYPTKILKSKVHYSIWVQTYIFILFICYWLTKIWIQCKENLTSTLIHIYILSNVMFYQTETQITWYLCQLPN